MKNTLLAILLFPCLLANPCQAAESLDLTGSDWSLHPDPAGTGEKDRMFNASVPAGGWIPATVPGNIQADVEALRKLRPLVYGPAAPEYDAIATKDWWYRKDFKVPQSFAGKRLTLVFQGVDQCCQVWLNGKKLGGHAGMFLSFDFDVTGIAKPGETNSLALQISKIPATEGHLKISRKWDWNVSVWTLGIWRDVLLEATGPVRIDWTRVETKLTDNYRKATVHASVEVNSTEEMPAKVEFQISGHGTPVTKTVPIKLSKGNNTVTAELPVEKPELWWPNGQGEQPLYTLTAKVVQENGTVSDTRGTEFGIREVRWIYTEGAKESDGFLHRLNWEKAFIQTAGEPSDILARYQLVINGRPVRTIGSGLIGPDLYLGCGQEHQLDLLRHAKALGMNFFRLNGGGGGGPSEREEWYALADRLGIMISSEVPIGGGHPQEDPVFVANVEKTLRCMIRQTRNHPSVIEYAGGNEIGWDSSSKHPALLAMSKAANEETDRIFRPTSPDLGATHGPYLYNAPETADAPKTDNWWAPRYVTLMPAGTAWHTYFNSVQTMRYAEFGTTAPAVLEVWKREIPPGSQWPIAHNDDPVLIRKNATRGWQPLDSWLFKPQIDRMFGNPGNLADMIRAGQFLGADGLRYAYDELRRKGKKIGGFTNHCFSEPWCNGAGSCMVDHDGRTWMVYDFLKQALAPVALALRFDSILFKPAEGINAELTLVSDAPAPVAGLKWSWLARDQQGKVFAKGEGSAEIAPIEVKSLAKLEIKPEGEAAEGLVFVELKLQDASGKLINERVQVFAPEKSLYAGLLGAAAKKPAAKAVARTGLQVSAKPMRTEGDEEILELTVTNTGNMTALFCEPHPQAAYRTDLFIGNNNCSIPPGESRVITIRATKNPECGLTLAQTGWEVTCWNADSQRIAPDSSVLFAVGRRDKMCQEFLEKNAWNAEAMVTSAKPLLINFECAKPAPVQLRVHTADQSPEVATQVEVAINGKRFEGTLPKGLGIQDKAPEHLAYPATLRFDLPAEALKAGANTLTIGVKGEGWFTLDAADAEFMAHQHP